MRTIFTGKREGVTEQQKQALILVGVLRSVLLDRFYLLSPQRLTMCVMMGPLVAQSLCPILGR